MIEKRIVFVTTLSIIHSVSISIVIRSFLILSKQIETQSVSIYITTISLTSHTRLLTSNRHHFKKSIKLYFIFYLSYRLPHYFLFSLTFFFCINSNNSFYFTSCKIKLKRTRSLRSISNYVLENYYIEFFCLTFVVFFFKKERKKKMSTSLE